MPAHAFLPTLGGLASLAALTLMAPVSAAEEENEPGSPADDLPCTSCTAPLSGDGRRGVGLELNVLWPFFPGGISAKGNRSGKISQ